MDNTLVLNISSIVAMFFVKGMFITSLWNVNYCLLLPVRLALLLRCIRQ